MTRFGKEYALKEYLMICKVVQTELILMDVLQRVYWVVETNGPSLRTFLSQFQPDPLLFPLFLPFQPLSLPLLSRVRFLQNSA